MYSTSDWTLGANIDHFADVGGNGTGKIDETRAQAYLAYHPDNKWNFLLSANPDYYWDAGEFIAPITLRVGRLTRLNDRLVNIGFGLGYWAKPTVIGPRGVQFSFVIEPVLNRYTR